MTLQTAKILHILNINFAIHELNSRVREGNLSFSKNFLTKGWLLSVINNV